MYGEKRKMERKKGYRGRGPINNSKEKSSDRMLVASMYLLRFYFFFFGKTFYAQYNILSDIQYL